MNETEQRIGRLRHLLKLAKSEREKPGYRGGIAAERIRTLAEKAWRLELQLHERKTGRA